MGEIFTTTDLSPSQPWTHLFQRLKQFHDSFLSEYMIAYNHILSGYFPKQTCCSTVSIHFQSERSGQWSYLKWSERNKALLIAILVCAVIATQEQRIIYISICVMFCILSGMY